MEVDLLHDPAEHERLARLNLEAGRKAKESAPAHKYLTTGIQLLPSQQEQALYPEVDRNYNFICPVGQYVTGAFIRTGKLVDSMRFLCSGTTISNQAIKSTNTYRPPPRAVARPHTRVNNQPGWSWCRKCQTLHFAPDTSKSRCPAGGRHTTPGSSAYYIPASVRRALPTLGGIQWGNL